MNFFQKTYALKDIDDIAKILCNHFSQYKIWIFKGDLGSGKTTLIQSIGKYLQVEDNINSPSFSIVQIYTTPMDQIYHIDLYRLKNLDDALNIGIEDMLISNSFCFIEWPQIIEPLLKKLPHIQIEINRESQEIRQLKVIAQVEYPQ